MSKPRKDFLPSYLIDDINSLKPITRNLYKKVITCEVDREFYRRIKDFASKNRLTTSDLIRTSLEQMIEDE